MLAEVRLVIAQKEARLTISKKGGVVDEEVWPLTRQVGASEAAEFARAVFDDAYDAMNFLAHGHDD